MDESSRASLTSIWRKHPGTVSRLPDTASVVIAEALARNPVGKNDREGIQQKRARKLGEFERAAIRQAVAEGKSLRSLADEFGVSHEAVRKACVEMYIR